jgi:hypothetical protein
MPSAFTISAFTDANAQQSCKARRAMPVALFQGRQLRKRMCHDVEAEARDGTHRDVEWRSNRFGNPRAEPRRVSRTAGPSGRPEQKAIAVANGASGDLQIIDGASLQITKTIALSPDADNVRYDKASNPLYVGHGSGALSVIDTVAWKVLGTIPLSGHPESFQLESAGTRAFVNVPDAGHIAVLDRKAMKVLTTWPVTTAKANYPMALDEGEGFLDVLAADDNRLTRSAHIATAAGARTSLFAGEQNRLFLAVPHRGTQKAEIRVYATPEIG